jgi:hypothetical protein
LVPENFIDLLQLYAVMREITIKIPEDKFSFFQQLITNLGFDFEVDIQIPEEHKEIVRERIKKSKPEDFKSWKEARKQLRFK